MLLPEGQLPVTILSVSVRNDTIVNVFTILRRVSGIDRDNNCINLHQNNRRVSRIASIVPANTGTGWLCFTTQTALERTKSSRVSLFRRSALPRLCRVVSESVRISHESNNSFLSGNPRALLLRCYSPSHFHLIYTEHIRNSRVCCCGTSFIGYLAYFVQSTLLPCSPQQHLFLPSANVTRITPG